MFLDLGKLRKSSGRQLRIDLLAVDADFEAAPIRGNQDKARQGGLQLGHELFGQTGRFRLVASRLAVDDLNFHGPLLFDAEPEVAQRDLCRRSILNWHHSPSLVLEFDGYDLKVQQALAPQYRELDLFIDDV